MLKFDPVFLKFRGFPLKINFWLICDLLKLHGFFPAPLDFNKKIWDFCEILVVIFSQGQKWSVKKKTLFYFLKCAIKNPQKIAAFLFFFPKVKNDR